MIYKTKFGKKIFTFVSRNLHEGDTVEIRLEKGTSQFYEVKSIFGNNIEFKKMTNQKESVTKTPEIENNELCCENVSVSKQSLSIISQALDEYLIFASQLADRCSKLMVGTDYERWLTNQADLARDLISWVMLTKSNISDKEVLPDIIGKISNIRNGYTPITDEEARNLLETRLAMLKK